jgi:hypothetical protein
MQVHDGADVKSFPVDPGVEIHGRRHRKIAMQHGQIGVEQGDAVGESLIEVFETRDPEGVFGVRPGTDVTRDSRVAALAVQHAAGGGDPEPDVRAVCVAHGRCS